MTSSYYATPFASAFIGAFFPFIGAVAIGIRFYFRYARKTAFSWDDWLCVPAWLFNLACGLVLIIGVAKGSIGHHMEAQSVSEVTSGSYNSQYISKVMYQCEWLLTSFAFLALGFMKLSVLFLYRRVFRGGSHGGNRIFSVLNWTMIVLVSLWTTTLSLTSIFVCGTHFEYQWSGWDVMESKCLDILTQNTWGCITDVIGDVFILLLPLPLIWRLHMPTGKKIAIICTILTGILSLVCGIFRLYINVEYNSSVLVVSGKINYVLGVSSADVIGMSTILLFWTQVEVGVANVAICLPAMRPGTLLTSRHSKALLNKIGMSWLASSHGTGQGSRSKRSYVQQRDLGDGPGIHRRSDDDSTAEIKGRISKTVRYSVDLSRRDTSKEGEVLDQRYTLVQYPVRAARKKERPFETV